MLIRHNPNLPLCEAAVTWDNGGPVYGPERAYILGDLPPNYPVPATLGICDIEPMWCLLYASDEERPNPLITWYSFAYDLPIPEDHGKPVKWN